MIALLERRKDFKQTFQKLTPSEIQKVELFFEAIGDIKIIKKRSRLISDLIHYSCDELKTRYDTIVENPNKRTIETYIARYGETIGVQKWNEYTGQQRTKNLFETKSKKYGWTKQQFDDFNKSRAVTKTLCISRHGEIKGIEIWNNYVAAQSFTNSLEYFVIKHGEDGEQKWKECNKQKGTSLYKRVTRSKTDKFIPSSNIEMSFVNQLCERIHDIKFVPQYFIREEKQLFFYDLCFPSINKIIEFNGDYWHCNPRKYSETYYHPQIKLFATQVWDRDNVKLNLATTHGFNVLVIWESDFRKDSETTILNVLKWLNS